MTEIIILASDNPVKRLAVENGFCRTFSYRAFNIHLVSIPSSVSNQPASDGETLQGACNRAAGTAQKFPQLDYWVGIEWGVDRYDSEMAAFAWVVIRSNNQLGKARAGTFYLPLAIIALIKQGYELGDADDQVFDCSNSKQEKGAVGLRTNSLIDRAALYEQAVILALIPFVNPHLYPCIE